jgi:hypothetical protein
MYESYLKMTSNDLHTHLTKKLKLHPERVKQIKDDVAIRKETQRTERITRTMRRQAWLDLLQPLRYELNSARVGAKYCPEGEEPDPLREEAFAAYIDVMERLLRKFEMPSSVLDNTPTQMAHQRNASGKGSPIPNAGAHWTDWVPAHIKGAIAQAFADLPHKPKAKRKVPFQRKTPEQQHLKHKMRLLGRTMTELANAERDFLIRKDKPRADLVLQLKRAVKIIEELTDNEHVPSTWRGLPEFLTGTPCPTNPKENEDED